MKVIDTHTDLAGNIPGKIAVWGEFKVAFVLVPVVHDYNVPRLHQDKEPYIIFTFIHLADAFIQSDLQLRHTISDNIIKRQTDTGSACNTNF